MKKLQLHSTTWMNLKNTRKKKEIERNYSGQFYTMKLENISDVESVLEC